MEAARARCSSISCGWWKVPSEEGCNGVLQKWGLYNHSITIVFTIVLLLILYIYMYNYNHGLYIYISISYSIPIHLAKIPLPIGSMVLVYMLTWLGHIDGIHVTIYIYSIHGSYGIYFFFDLVSFVSSCVLRVKKGLVCWFPSTKQGFTSVIRGTFICVYCF